MIRKLAITLLMMLSPVAFSSCQSGGNNKKPEPVVDDTYLTVAPEYEYKIVKCGSTVQVPTIYTNRDDYKQVTYVFNLETITGETFVIPSQPGVYLMKIYVLDVNYKPHTVEVNYRATNNDNDLNIIYDLATVEGLENHLGKSRSGVNGQRITLYQNGSRTYENPYGDLVTDYPVDIDGILIPSFENVDTAQTIQSFIVAENQTTITRLVYSNALNVNWDKKYSQVYFYFYNGAGADLKLNFNGYTVTIAKNSGWSKIIIAPEVVNGKTVTNYDVISSNGQSTSQTGMIDLEDCVGTFLKVEFTNSVYYGKYAMSSIWGKPLEA